MMYNDFPLFAITVILIYPLYNVIYNLFFSKLSRVPGPRIWAISRLPFIKGLLMGTLVHDIQKLHHNYGPIVRVAPDEVAFASPDAWTDILQGRPGHMQFLKDHIWWKTQPGMPESLISMISPNEHSRMRKLLAPGFTERALKAQEPIIQNYVCILIEKLCALVNDKGKAAELDIWPWFNFTTFDIFGELGFGESFNCLENSRYHPWIALLFNGVKAAGFIGAARFYPLIDFLLIKFIPKSLKKMQMDHYLQIADKVDRRINWEMERPDLMSNVIQERGKGKNFMTLDEIKTTFMILTTAGSETTATVLGGTINYLIAHPEVLARLTKEVRENFTNEQMDLNSLQGLQYLNAVLNEGLRLCPPIPWILTRRVPPGGDIVCGTWLPGGTAVSIQAYTMYRDPSMFHDAASFHPERWLPEATSNTVSPFYHDQRHAMQAFSTGPRSCMGKYLAWAELRLILARLVWAFDIEAGRGHPVRWEELRTFLLVEKKNINVQLRLSPAKARG